MALAVSNQLLTYVINDSRHAGKDNAIETGYKEKTWNKTTVGMNVNSLPPSTIFEDDMKILEYRRNAFHF